MKYIMIIYLLFKFVGWGLRLGWLYGSANNQRGLFLESSGNLSGPIEKSFLVKRYLKTERCIRLTLLVRNGTFFYNTRTAL